MKQVRFSKRCCLREETWLDGRSADHRGVPGNLDHCFLVFAGCPGIFTLQRLGDGGR